MRWPTFGALLTRSAAKSSSGAAVEKEVAPRKTLNRSLGDMGERAAAQYLQKHGYRILVRNHRCPAGEIDIIAEHSGVLAFVEVKTRSPRALASPRSAVDVEKQRRIRNSAAHYLGAFREPSPHRFDIVEVYLDSRDHVERLEMLQGAF
jgi:putative endonuclease